MAHGQAYDIVIVGGGSAGISTASSLLRRRAGLDIAIIEPSEHHYYQPGWLIEGTRPRKLSWLLKSEILPWVYWNGMLKGHEWLVKPRETRAL